MTIEQAEQFEEQELYDKAYAEYKKLLEKRPNSVEILQRTAHVAKILGLIEDAEKYFSSPARAGYDFDWAFRNFVKKFILYVDLHQR